MAVNGTPAEATAIGRVVAVNEKGIRFEGAESWSNYSKFAVGIVPPSRGDTVSVTFDRQGFIRAIVPADGRASHERRYQRSQGPQQRQGPHH